MSRVEGPSFRGLLNVWALVLITLVVDSSGDITKPGNMAWLPQLPPFVYFRRL